MDGAIGGEGMNSSKVADGWMGDSVVEIGEEKMDL